MPIIFICLTGSRIFGLQKQGRGHAKMICLVHTRTAQETRPGAALMYNPEIHRVVISQSLVLRSTFMIIDHTKSRVMPPGLVFQLVLP